jgi:dipeptidyl aminopeptidase/acylaminoacyl peptidase
MRRLLCCALVALSGGLAPAQSKYQKAPEPIRKVLDAPAPPVASLSPDRATLLLADPERYPPIADLARPVLRLAGLRIDPRTNGPQLPPRYTAFTLVNVTDGKSRAVELPAKSRPSRPVWSPDSKRFAFLNTTADRVELWLGDAATGKVKRAEGLAVNAAYADAIHWLPDSKGLLCHAVPSDRGKPPARPQVPDGPTIQESSGKTGPVITFQDLLRNRHDEDLFDYYATSQLLRVDADSGKATPLGKPGVYRDSAPSPDGKYVVTWRTHRPYSYLQPASAFPTKIEVWDSAGKSVHALADLPLADRVPIQGVPTGPRSVRWKPTDPATLVWVEALDGGDPKKKVRHRDQILSLAAPFTGKPKELLRTEERCVGITWGEKGTALVSDYERDKRRMRTYLVNLEDAKPEPKLIWDRSVQDRYGDPGTPVLRSLPNGSRVLLQSGDDVFLAGQGASAKGDRPFLDRFNLKTQKATRLFHSGEKEYESVVAVLSDDGSKLLTQHETPASPPNYRVRSGDNKQPKALTSFADTTPGLRKITKKLVTYKREDGVHLSFTLYLPPGYKEGTKLATVVWAYPREYNDPSVASQVSGSPNRFTTIAGPSHLFFLLAGYAVLDDAAMPVVGDPEKANDTFVEQVVASAKAAIDKAVDLGVTDRDRVGVGGHSYGAFMTANLLAHSDLFRAGIARSGAYNRTLTPFGFQNERRTFWEAPEVYLRASPFRYAHKIDEPILLIHGEADNNTGTFPIQSERLYQAIRGNGGTVRYVTLPHESHGYAARESVEHVLYEMIAWFDKHVKEAPARKR